MVRSSIDRLTIAFVIDTATVPGNWQTETRYLLTDHLGSVDVVTGDTGNVVERLSFDAWGKRRKLDWTVYALGTSYAWQGNAITRGFTMHEQLDPVGLVHMNGRVYDPELGRFMSPDIVIQDVSNLQSINAYSYVLNNPLSLTDPTGYFFSGLFKAIGNFFRSIFRAIGNVFKAIINSQIGRAIIQIAACASMTPACLAVTAALTLAAGGSLADAFQAVAFTFVSAGVWTGVGEVLRTAGLATNFLAKGALHGVVGGALSVAQGGTFMQGFAANAIGGAAGVASGDTGFGGNIYTDTAFVATAGGLAAELTGGKFVNGAITAGFANLYNKGGGCGHGTPGCKSKAHLSNEDMIAIGEVALGVVPVVGELQDLSVLYGDYSPWQKLAAGGSLVLNAATGGLLPNIGGSLRAYNHNYSYADRVLTRQIEDPRAHGFPYSFDDAILQAGSRMENNGYTIIQHPGTLNNKVGVYELGVTRGGVIDHRFFRPDR